MYIQSVSACLLMPFYHACLYYCYYKYMLHICPITSIYYVLLNNTFKIL